MKESRDQTDRGQGMFRLDGHLPLVLMNATAALTQKRKAYYSYHV